MVTFFHSFILWLVRAFLYKWIFFEKLKNSVEAYLWILIDNNIFIVWWVFIKRMKLRSTFLNNDNAYVKTLIQNTQTESTERQKISFPKNRNRKKRQTWINPFKQNNDHTRVMRKIGFRSSLNSFVVLTVFFLLSIIYIISVVCYHIIAPPEFDLDNGFLRFLLFLTCGYIWS